MWYVLTREGHAIGPGGNGGTIGAHYKEAADLVARGVVPRDTWEIPSTEHGRAWCDVRRLRCW